MEKEIEPNVDLFERSLRQAFQKSDYGKIAAFFPDFPGLVEKSLRYEKERYQTQMELKKLSNRQIKQSLKFSREEKELFKDFFLKIGSGDPIDFKKAVHEIEPLEIRKVFNRVYREYRQGIILDALKAQDISWNKALSPEIRLGCGVDERVLEFPLALEILDPHQNYKILDAGAALNVDYLKESIKDAKPKFVHYTLNSDKEIPLFQGDKYSYCFGDLCAIDFKDETFDRVICISTIEHIGMDNERYGVAQGQKGKEAYLQAVREMFRVLKKDGKMMLSFPFGGKEAQDRGWYRIFNWEDLQNIVRSIPSAGLQEKYYIYQKYWREVAKKDFDQVAQQDHSSAVTALLFSK